jgi:lipopolysaccharide transport system permease protein
MIKAEDSRLTPDTRIVIEAGRRGAARTLQELWRHRDLFYLLALRDIKVRYKQTVLGAAWAILQPFLTMVVFTFFFGRLAKVPSDGVPYPVFVYAGLVPWTFFANSVSAAATSLVENATLVTKVYFPRAIIPAAAVAAGLIDFIIAAFLLFAIMAYFRLWLTWQAILMIPLLLLTTLFSIGLGLWLSALNVKYRDVRYALPFFIQLLMYISPVIYPVSFVPRRWHWLMLLNPLTSIIEGYHAALFHRALDLNALGVGTLITVVLLVAGAYSFRQTERTFADVV